MCFHRIFRCSVWFVKTCASLVLKLDPGLGGTQHGIISDGPGYFENRQQLHYAFDPFLSLLIVFSGDHLLYHLHPWRNFSSTAIDLTLTALEVACQYILPKLTLVLSFSWLALAPVWCGIYIF